MCCGFVHLSEYATFMSLKVVVCISSDCVEYVFSGLILWVMGRLGEGYICSDGGERAEM